ncbi:MAG: hypothetical protein LBB25_02820 [Holosporaceae bacterium]|jgi:hypothetical protein|nr:hypothetical protein [Holosporaceae bacterium]
MKIDFKSITADNIKDGSIFYLYGNYKKTFEVFCSFMQDKFREKGTNVDIYLCSISECLKKINKQCDLFSGAISCFCIRNIEDDHLEKVHDFLNCRNCIFILESGNYSRSKKITDFFWKSRVFAIASFHNELTIKSLIKMHFPHISSKDCDELTRIIYNTDEELYSVFKKLSLLWNDHGFEYLKDYSTYRQTFLSGLDQIPLIRLLLQATIKERITKSTDFSPISIQSKDAIYHLLNAELIQKSGFNIGRGYIYGPLILGDNLKC